MITHVRDLCRKAIERWQGVADWTHATVARLAAIINQESHAHDESELQRAVELAQCVRFCIELQTKAACYCEWHIVDRLGDTFYPLVRQTAAVLDDLAAMVDSADDARQLVHAAFAAHAYHIIPPLMHRFDLTLDGVSQLFACDLHLVDLTPMLRLVTLGLDLADCTSD